MEAPQWLESRGSMIGKWTTGNQEILKNLMGRMFISKVIEKNGKSLPEC
ncbi:hypothetical protein [Pseudomonas sp. ZL2]